MNWIKTEEIMPENCLQIHNIETNGHQFIDAATDEVFVTDEFKKDIRKCIRKHSTHPAFGEYWFWSDVDGNKFDNFQVKYWSPLKPTFIIHK